MIVFKNNHRLIEVLGLILKITFSSFGGGNALLPNIHTIFVVQKQWINEQEFDQIVLTTNSLPGANVIQLLSYIAIKRLGLWQGMIVTFMGILPNVLLVILLYYLLDFLPRQYLLVINVSVIAAIVGLLIGFIISYFQKAYFSGIRTIYLLAISTFTFLFCFFTPSPFNLPAAIIFLAFLVLLVVSWYRDWKPQTTCCLVNKKTKIQSPKK